MEFSYRYRFDREGRTIISVVESVSYETPVSSILLLCISGRGVYPSLPPPHLWESYQQEEVSRISTSSKSGSWIGRGFFGPLDTTGPLLLQDKLCLVADRMQRHIFIAHSRRDLKWSSFRWYRYCSTRRCSSVIPNLKSSHAFYEQLYCHQALDTLEESSYVISAMIVTDESKWQCQGLVQSRAPPAGGE
ncbi:hypothetical protein J6590_039047 [Homalodisca vitripennis]|nr:hypothetical protein J6590_039047 [Homalodisca vitripennis]